MAPRTKKDAQPLGRALQRRQVKNKAERAARENAMDVDGSAARGKLVSVLETTSMDDFLAAALVKDRAFEAQQGSGTRLIGADGVVQVAGYGDGYDDEQDDGSGAAAALRHGTFEQLSVPRRPHWTEGMTADELDRRERESFLAWRRAIADAEESRTGATPFSTARVTPFEKNIEVWRQLWRVMERSDLLVQIVDARNPLFYYSEDLHASAGELQPPRPMLMLVNKSDFLSRRQRKAWAAYFRGRGWPCLFFSARRSQELLNKAARAAARAEAAEAAGLYPEDEVEVEVATEDVEESDSSSSSSDEGGSSGGGSSGGGGNSGGSGSGDESEGEESDDEGARGSSRAAAAAAVAGAAAPAAGEDDEDFGGDSSEDGRVLSREELLEELERRTIAAAAAGLEAESDDGVTARSRSERDGGRRCVGMVGYPNVGKSSVINVLLGATPLSHGAARVSVGATPGKTKHFQTLPLSASLLLCDCPGLVFPSFVSSAAEMVCAGVLPITQTRDHTAPAALIARRVPRHILELAYTIRLPKAKDAVAGAAAAAAAKAADALPPVPEDAETPAAVATANGEEAVPPAAPEAAQLDASAAAAAQSALPAASAGAQSPAAAAAAPAPAVSQQPTAEELLNTLALARGYYRGAAAGDADWPRAARLLLRDYTEGRMLFCHAPPNPNNPAETAAFELETEKTALRSTKLAAKLERRRQRAEGAAAAAATAAADASVAGSGGGQAAAAAAAAGAPKGPTRREQGRKKWGKKGKKMLDPTPYEDKGNTLPGEAPAAGPIAARRKHYGAKSAAGFSRAVLPHHQSYGGAASG